MCESTVIIEQDDNSEEVMHDVVKVSVRNHSVVCIDVTGNINEFSDVIIHEIDSLRHVIILKKD
jgi:predicted RNA-binding protein